MMMIEMCIAEIILLNRLKGMGWKRICAIKIPVSDIILMKILVIKDNVDDLDPPPPPPPHFIKSCIVKKVHKVYAVKVPCDKIVSKSLRKMSYLP